MPFQPALMLAGSTRRLNVKMRVVVRRGLRVVAFDRLDVHTERVLVTVRGPTVADVVEFPATSVEIARNS